MATSNVEVQDVAEPQPGHSPSARLRTWASAHLALLSLPVLIGAIEIVVWLFGIPSYVLPAPHEVINALVAGFAKPLDSRAGFYLHITTTLIEALAAFIGGSILGIAMGAAVIQFPVARKLVLPYVVGLQSVPKVALAPLFVVWFGLGISSKIVLGVLLTFFPLLINTAAGLASVERDKVELMISLKASRWKTFRLVQFPSALPYIFAGLEMAAVYSILGAVVGEFVGGQSGLGVLILNRNAVLDIAGSLAALVILAVMGILLQTAVGWLRSWLLFWSPAQDKLKLDETEGR